MTRTISLALAAASFFALATPAIATPHRNSKHHHHRFVPHHVHFHSHFRRHSTHHRFRRVIDASGNRAQIIGGRPSGCPHAFCGCEASIFLFGRIKPELNLAFNWIRKFPRTSPAPMMAAARRGHVFVLLRHIEGSVWLVHDGNSGGHKTRVHTRSIAGYVVVNPHAQLARL